MALQIYPDTAVGMESNKTYPVTIDGLAPKKSEAKIQASTGSNTFAPRKNTKMLFGFLTTLKKAEELMPKLPQNVTNANNTVTELFIQETCDPRISPRITPKGVSIGIIRSSMKLNRLSPVSRV